MLTIVYLKNIFYPMKNIKMGGNHVQSHHPETMVNIWYLSFQYFSIQFYTAVLILIFNFDF